MWILTLDHIANNGFSIDVAEARERLLRDDLLELKEFSVYSVVKES